MFGEKSILVGAMVMVLGLFATVSAVAKTESWAKSVTVEDEKIVYGVFFDTNLKIALNELSKASGITVRSEEDLAKVKVDDVVLWGRTSEDALEMILVGTGYWFTETAEGYFVAPEAVIKERLKAKEVEAMEIEIARIKKEKEQELLRLKQVKEKEIAEREAKIRELKERLALVQASQELAEKEKARPRGRFVLYAVGLDPEYKQVNLGGRFEINLLPTNLRVAIEGVELERGKPVQGFLSLILAPFHKVISPYAGIGIGMNTAKSEERKYEVYVGTEMGESFFLEVKYIGRGEIDLPIADVYSVAGFKIAF